MQDNDQNYDITVIGSGIVGAAVALALAKNTSLRIAVLEAKTPFFEWQVDQYYPRVSAISLSSKHIFEHLKVWDSIVAKRISPYCTMQVWDSVGTGRIHFSAEALQEEALGYIIEDNVMRISLLQQFQNYKNLNYLFPLKIISLEECSDHYLLNVAQNKSDHVTSVRKQEKSNHHLSETGSQKIIKTKLLIAADGAESWMRNAVGIELKTWDYKHTAIIATVRTELPHDAMARQCFLPTGPLAFLPLADSNTSSIVWSVTADEATYLLSLNDTDFSKKLAEAFENKLGAIISVSQRQSHPLRMRHAKHYVRERLALVGDAAHTIHPLAGQGVNLGLLDAAALAEVIIDAHKKNRHFESLATLRRFERWRKGDTIAMLAMVEALKHLFASEHQLIKYLRSAGLSMTNRATFLKHFMANYALGRRGDLPEMANVSFR
jgi:2-octaprenylphenol hydroxylase